MINSDSLKNTQNEEYIEDSLGKQLERVAIEYNQMQHLLGRGKGLSFVVDNEWRIRRIDDVFHQKLSNSLSSTLSQLCLGGITRSTRKSLTEYLRIYALIDQTHIAEDIICKEFVKPAMDRIITPFSMDGKRDSVDEDTKHPLTAMYNKILSFAHTDLQPILDITQKLLKGTNYEVLVNCLWIECIDKINKECRSIFALGQTDIFHKNYSATIIFINEIEKLCYSRRSVLYLRNHPSYSEFMKRWQLLVYFQLRFREIVAPVEEILNNRTESIAIKDDISQELILPGSQTIYRAIKQCWSDNVYVYGLCHRLWNLTLQLMKRYHGWIISIKSDKKARFFYMDYE
ncbi:hypothetical protein BDB01DRAFT_518017 [Pilobolus umbonatus]|nr:hypothetical protein BDB01DRAFT_518017 [Pilobolus umbonatus]